MKQKTFENGQPVMINTLNAYWPGRVHSVAFIKDTHEPVYIVDAPALRCRGNIFSYKNILTMEEYRNLTMFPIPNKEEPMNGLPVTAHQPAPKSELLSPGVEQIPFEGLEAIGQIFSEGEKKYGLNNWKMQPDNIEYNRERTRHAIRHLMLWANGDRSEPHLAKVAWFCVTTIWREKNKT